MFLLRFYIIIIGLTIVGAILVGLLLKDRRWFRFAWQLFKFSLVLLLVVGAAFAIGRIFLL